MTPSPESMEEQSQWTNIESMMAEMLSTHENQSAPNTATAQSVIALLNDISSETHRLHASSGEISNNLSTSIQNEKRALNHESNELSQQLSHVQHLETQISTLQQSNSEMLSKRREAEQSIPLHAAVASEHVEELDEIQSRHIRKLPKIKQELSLHALMTNIKWDYHRTDVLAGEVSIPAKAVHRRFVIEKDDLSEFEIAERLWCMIEG